MKLGKILALAIPILTSSWAEQAWAVWDCKAYADFAIRDVNKAQAAQCGFTGSRWSADSGLHYGFCVERLNAGDDNAMTNETNIRESEVAACEVTHSACTDYTNRAIGAVNRANQLGCGYQPPRWSSDPGLHYGFCIDRKKAGDDNAVASETDIRAQELAACEVKSGQQATCTDYARTAVAAATEANELNCGFQPPRWSTDEGLHFGYCTERAAAGDTFAIANETSIRATELNQCKAKAPPPGGGTTKTVVAEVTVYDAPEGGSDVCYLGPNDKVTVLTGAEIPESFRNPTDQNWVPVRGSTGDCDGKIGGVYDDGKLK